MKSLDELAIFYKTDKSSLDHSYTQYYEMFFSGLREKEISLLEIGVQEGNSLRMWKDYFPKGIINGFDIENCAHQVEERINIYRGDQGKPEDLEKFNQSFDIIIDDGSHNGIDQLTSFTTLFKYLKPGGFYCIEDLLCSYHEPWNEPTNILNEIKDSIDILNLQGKITKEGLNSDKRKQVQLYPCGPLEKNIEWIFNSMGLVIIKKL